MLHCFYDGAFIVFYTRMSSRLEVAGGSMQNSMVMCKDELNDINNAFGLEC